MSAWLLVATIIAAEQDHAIPPGLLAAVVLHESGGHWQVRHERMGGCSVGPAQVYFRDCSRRHRRHELRANVEAGARILARSLRTCAARPRLAPCRVSGGIGLYNPGNARRWSAAVWRIHRRLTAPPRGER